MASIFLGLNVLKYHMILEIEQRNPIINRLHAPTKVNGCTKYGQDPLNVGKAIIWTNVD